MKRLHKNFAFLLFLLCTNQLLFPNTDTNNKEIPPKNNGPEEQFRALLQLSVDNWKNAPASSIIYGEEALAIARKLNNERMEAEALNNIGNVYFISSNREQAIIKTLNHKP